MNSVPSVVVNNRLSYPQFPYLPDKPYPELRLTRRDRSNRLYGSVRQLLFDLGLDASRYGTAQWNPFFHYVKPGDRVVIKPNWVKDANPANPASIDELVTHPGVIRPLIDYAVLAMGGRGVITLADAPLQSCDFDALIKKLKINELMADLRQSYPNVTFELIDLRKTVMKGDTSVAFAVSDKHYQSGDPRGYTLVDLKKESLLGDIAHRSGRFRVTHYDYRKLLPHHTDETNEYLIANSILDADFIINVAKMKCHLKAGLTGALKNLVGINGHKEYLPHHTNGSLFEGGDQFPHPSRLKELHNRLYDWYWSQPTASPALKFIVRWILGLLIVLIRAVDRDDLLDGGWFGNQTVARMTVDINNLLYFYRQKTSRLQPAPVRRALHIVDGVVGGEGDGPLKPTPVESRCLIGGFDPLEVDTCMARLMGYEPRAIPTLLLARTHKLSRLSGKTPSADSVVVFNGQRTPLGRLPNFHYKKPKWWRLAEA